MLGIKIAITIAWVSIIIIFICMARKYYKESKLIYPKFDYLDNKNNDNGVNITAFVKGINLVDALYNGMNTMNIFINNYNEENKKDKNNSFKITIAEIFLIIISIFITWIKI